MLAVVMAPAAMALTPITCYSDRFAPFVITQGERVTGVDVDALVEAGRRAGLAVTVSLLPWVRLEGELRRGLASEVDCAFAYTYSEPRSAYMDFVRAPLKVTTYTLFVRRDRASELRSLKELRGATIGMRRGFRVPGEFELMRLAGDLKVDEVDNDEANFLKLSAGRVDGVMTNSDVGQALIRDFKLANVVAVRPAITVVPTYVVFNKAKNLRHWVAPLEEALGTMRSDGSYDRIRRLYLPE